MNILLFGKTGQVGWELQRALVPLVYDSFNHILGLWCKSASPELYIS